MDSIINAGGPGARILCHAIEHLFFAHAKGGDSADVITQMVLREKLNELVGTDDFD